MSSADPLFVPVRTAWPFFIHQFYKGCFSRVSIYLLPACHSQSAPMETQRCHCRASVASWSFTVTHITNECHSCLWGAHCSSPALQLRWCSSGLSSKLLQFLIAVTWEHKHTLTQRRAKSVGLQVIPVCISWMPSAQEGRWVLHFWKEWTKPQIQSTQSYEGFGSRYRLVLENLPISSHPPISSHCFFPFCFHLTMCQSTEAACCSATIASCSSIYGTKAVLVPG